MQNKDKPQPSDEQEASEADATGTSPARWTLLVSVSTLALLGLACAFGRFVWVVPVFNPTAFRLDENTETLIIGASRSDACFDTTQIPNSRSVSLNGEPLFFTYHKLRNILNNNTGVKNVIMATGAAHVGICQDRYLYAEDSISRRNHMAYYPFLNAEGKRQIRRFSEYYITAAARYDYGLPLGYMKDLKPVINHYRQRFAVSDFECWQGSGPIDAESHVSLSHIEKKIDSYFYDNGDVGSQSQLAVEHMEKLVRLCESTGIRLWMIKTPLHENFRDLVPQDCIDTHSELVQTLAQNHEHVELLDYSTMPLDTLKFYDGDHLNSDGARDFTAQFVSDFNPQQAPGS